MLGLRARVRTKVEGRALPQQTFSNAFELLLAEIRVAVEAVDLDRALALSERALACAEEDQDPEARDRALGNRASFLLALGRSEGVATEQQAVLFRSQDPVNRYFAAYNLSLVHHQRENFERSLFYGRMALEAAGRSEDAEFHGRAHNRVANVLIAQSYFGEAYEHCEQSLALLPGTSRVNRALVRVTAGYCLSILERLPEAFTHLHRSLRTFRRLRNKSWERLSDVRIALCYAYIEAGRLDHAARHGNVALDAARDAEDSDRLKKALYLLGEVEKQRGDTRGAFQLFSRLQHVFFPDHPQLVDLLMQAQTHRLVNLLA